MTLKKSEKVTESFKQSIVLLELFSSADESLLQTIFNPEFMELFSLPFPYLSKCLKKFPVNRF